MIKTYNPQKAWAGSSNFINYMGASAIEYERIRQEIFAEYPNSVIIDGDDDLIAKREMRPQTFIDDFGINVLAYYHSGISGITKSGIVISKTDYDILARKYMEKYNKEISFYCRVYR